MHILHHFRIRLCLDRLDELFMFWLRLSHTDRPAGSVLACCRIHLPRPGAGLQSCLDPVDLMETEDPMDVISSWIIWKQCEGFGLVFGR